MRSQATRASAEARVGVVGMTEGEAVTAGAVGAATAGEDTITARAMETRMEEEEAREEALETIMGGTLIIRANLYHRLCRPFRMEALHR